MDIFFFFFFYHFNEQQKQQILDMQQELLEDGKIRPEEILEQEYEMFRRRFSPEVLRNLRGEALIETIFNVMNRDSLAYWLEFKNDETFRTQQYGSVAGGGAHKYIIYKRKKDQKWVAGTSQEELTPEEAIRRGTAIRDAILRGVEFLNSLRLHEPGEEDYRLLQELLDSGEECRIGHYGWIHKYYHMLFPHIIDSYHSTSYQIHTLLCSGVKPVVKDQLYPLGGQVMQLVNQLPMPPCHAIQAMRHIYGDPVSYYRVGTTSGRAGESMWERMYPSEYISIGWQELGDLRQYECESDSETKQRILEKYESVYPNAKQTMSRKVNEIIRFYRTMKVNDIVVACEGTTVLGIGRVIGTYDYLPDLEFPHIRRVEWLYCKETQLPKAKEGLQTTVFPYKDFDNLLEIRRLAASGEKEALPQLEPESEKEKPLPPLPAEISRIHHVLQRKKQIILYGPPGTGKTFYAEMAAQELAARSRFKRPYAELDEEERGVLLGDGRTGGYVRMCCFHPSYGYEDFIEGIKPRPENGTTIFELRSGIFKQLCEDAHSQPAYDHFLIVDEINRGDISRIFGELIMLVENNKRGKALSLPVSGERFSVPENVYLIGTMNTADRSIALLDAALRRRFGFQELLPDYSLLEGVVFGTLPLASWLRQLNQRICQSLGRDARNMQIGHSYFMAKGKAIQSQERFRSILAEDILPLIEEYCYGDYAKMAEILGIGLVDTASQLLQYSLIQGDWAELENALLQPYPDIQQEPNPDEDEEVQEGEDEDSEA